MFTGIIQALGQIAEIQSKGTDLRLRIATGALALDDVRLGDSIAVSGVCLTVVDLPGDGFWADVSAETVTRSVLGEIVCGSAVNLEKALTASTRLGGHLVSGHVDGVGTLIERRVDGRSVILRVRIPSALARYVAEKGSICVDGVSLTVNRVHGAEFELNIVPHTLAQTTLGEFSTGRRVNLEVDVIARYLERLLLGEQAAVPSEGVTRDLLARHGFLHDNH